VNREIAQTKNPQDKLVRPEMGGPVNKARRNCSVRDRTGTELPICQKFIRKDGTERVKFP